MFSSCAEVGPPEDENGGGGGGGDVVVGGAAVPLYTGDGILQCGLLDVRLRIGVSDPARLISVCSAESAVRDEMTELARLVKQHHRGEIEKVDWLVCIPGM